MANLCYLVFYNSGKYIPCMDMKSFYFKKDRYNNYTDASGRFVGDYDLDGASVVYCYVNGRNVHCGMIDQLEKKFENGCWNNYFKSRGFTALLGQNEPVPGMNYSMTLDKLGKINTSIPNVSYQSGTSTVNYIYVKEHSTIWDAITAYSMKAYSRQPFISGTNTVKVYPSSTTLRNYDGQKIVNAGTFADRRTMLSTVYMADADGSYSNTLSNQPAIDMKIIREKYYSLDKQWLSSPESGLNLKLMISNRRYSGSFFTYVGYLGEELYDLATVSNDKLSLTRKNIKVIEINVKDCTVFTTLEFFDDGGD